MYKYRTVERLDWLEQIVLQNVLYFPTARDLNDPLEARPRLRVSSARALAATLFENTVERMPHLTNNGLSFHGREIEVYVRQLGTEAVLRVLWEILEPLLTRFRIYSLSKRPDNSHLWANYAGGHTGYCLEFRNTGEWPVWEVRYEDVTLDISDDTQVQPYFLFYKTNKWWREEEVRMMKQQVSDANTTFNPSALTRIILGRNITPGDESAIRAMAARRSPPLAVVLEPRVSRRRKMRR